jgi:hypothetical protein
MIRSILPRWCALLAVALPAVILTGCSGTSVSGNVTLDGAPVDGGVILFLPQTGSPAALKSANGPIVGGKYSLEGAKAPQPGKYRVQIEWKKKTGQQIPVPGDPGNTTEETVQMVPPMYNQQSTLEADVKGGANTFNYDLKSR